MGCAGKVGSAPSDPDGGGNVVLPECTPSVLEYIQDFVPSASITFSINDGEKVTLQVPPANASADEFHQYQLQFINYMTAGDGESIAFMSAFFTSLNTPPPAEAQPGQVFTQLSGISADGKISVYGTEHDVKDLTVDASLDGVTPDKYTITSTNSEKTTIKIYPTVGVDKALDDYYSMPGANDNGDPVVLTSCARAVLEPFVCTPVGTLAKEVSEATHSRCHAKYRVNNGDWVIYSKELNSSNVHQAHKDFLFSITAPELTLINLMPTEEGENELVTIKNVRLIADGGSGYISHLVDSSGRSDLDPDFNPSDQAIDVWLPSPFVYCKDNWSDDYVAAASSVNTPADEFVYPNGDYGAYIPPSTIKHVKPTTIEFVKSTGTGLDLVQAMFDGDKTISACGFSEWGGV